jgi:hypothetical protein
MDDLDSLLTLLAGASPRSLRHAAGATSVYRDYYIAHSEFSNPTTLQRVQHVPDEARGSLDALALELRNAGMLADAGMLYAMDLSSLDAVRLAMKFVGTIPGTLAESALTQLVRLYALLTAGEHRAIARALEPFSTPSPAEVPS